MTNTNTTVPCPDCTKLVKQWRLVRYNPEHPMEWPGGPLMDSRTTHAERRRDWERKTAERIQQILDTCRKHHTTAAADTA
jgi:hypothetical protein